MKVKIFDESHEEDLEDDSKGGPYIIIICGDSNEVLTITNYIKTVKEVIL